MSPVLDHRSRSLYEVLMETSTANVTDLDSRCGMLSWPVSRASSVLSETKLKDKLSIAKLIIRKIIEEFHITINRNHVTVTSCCL